MCVFTVVSETDPSLAISVRETARDVSEDLQLARGQLVQLGERFPHGLQPTADELLDDTARDRLESSASPFATTRIASTNCSGDVSLSKKPLAPPERKPHRRIRRGRTWSG